MMDKEQEQKKAWLREYRLSMERVRSLAEELRRWQDIAEKLRRVLTPFRLAAAHLTEWGTQRR